MCLTLSLVQNITYISFFISVSESHVRGVLICMHAIKFGYFLLLMFHVNLIIRLEDPKRIKESFFLSHSPLLMTN